MTREPWLASYTRKSRHLDKEVPEEELFRKHRQQLERLAREKGLPIPLERYFQEVGSSETIDERPVFSALLAEIDQLPASHGGHLLIPDFDRLTRADTLEQAQIIRRLKRAGIVLHMVLGGDCDLTDVLQRRMVELKSWVALLLMDDYKRKQAVAWDGMRRNGEIRNGRVPFGYWWDKSEKLTRDRIKMDDRSADHTGFTPWEKLQRCCQEALTVSVAELSRRYSVAETTLYSALATPTIAGWPVTRIYKDPDRTRRSHMYRQRRDGDPEHPWLWPDHAGTYPAACTLDHWYQLQEAIGGRRDSAVKNHHGTGICQDVLRIEGCAGPVILSRRKMRGSPASYRQLGDDNRRSSRGARDIDRDVVDAHASAAIRDLVADAAFFAWLFQDYYQARSREEPRQKDDQLREVQERIRRWQQERAKATRWALAATTATEERRWSEAARDLDQLIDAAEREREALRRLRSPIPAVDAAVPLLIELARAQDPAYWAAHWEAIWARLSPATRRLLVRMLIQEIPVRYQQRCRRGPVQRVLLPVVYTAFVAEARSAYALSTCSRVCQTNVGEVWRQIELLAA